MSENADSDRRGFLGRAAMAMAAAQFGVFGAKVDALETRELAAIGRAAVWLNSPPLTPSSLGGKVVLVDFCTYTCINWLRALPYRRAWARKYQPRLVVIGVHTPEFGFEKDVENVRRAIRQMRIEYPIAIDNDSSIWRAFDNRYWPALYFIDARGRVRQHQFGEGEYQRSEEAIQRLLGEAGAAGAGVQVEPVAAAGIETPADWDNLKSPERYLGYGRTERFGSPGGMARDRGRTYAFPARLSINQWGLEGEWTIGREAVVLNRPQGRLTCRFHARDLHLVMGPPRYGTPMRFRVTLDGQPPGPAHGIDVDEGGNGHAVEQRLHQLIRQTGPIIDRRFEIEFLDQGIETFAFTFG